MEFALNVEYGNRKSSDRVSAFEAKYEFFNHRPKVDCTFHVNALIKTTLDFDISSDPIQFVSDNCSVQWRPKGLHKNTKGVFYKLGSKVIYLSDEEVSQMNLFIETCLEQKTTLTERKGKRY